MTSFRTQSKTRPARGLTDSRNSRTQLAERQRTARKIVKALKRLIPQATTALRYSNPWELLVAVMLSARCTDKKVNEVTEKLFRKYRTLDDYVHADPREFEQDIRPTGFYKEKAKRILEAARFLRATFRGQVPRTMGDMLRIPGVGRKTANIVLGAGYGVVEGIAVDTHVRRLARGLGLTDQTDPDKIEQDLLKLIPRREWLAFSFRLSEYGRKYCPARPHDHSGCPLTRILARTKEESPTSPAGRRSTGPAPPRSGRRRRTPRS